MKTAYRVYLYEEGSAPCFCGECDTEAEAEELAESAPDGLEKSLWDTARAAGHCAGMTAPDTSGTEDDEPWGWNDAGTHCIVRVQYGGPEPDTEMKLLQINYLDDSGNVLASHVTDDNYDDGEIERWREWLNDSAVDHPGAPEHWSQFELVAV